MSTPVARSVSRVGLRAKSVHNRVSHRRQPPPVQVRDVRRMRPRKDAGDNAKTLARVTPGCAVVQKLPAKGRHQLRRRIPRQIADPPDGGRHAAPCKTADDGPERRPRHTLREWRSARHHSAPPRIRTSAGRRGPRSAHRASRRRPRSRAGSRARDGVGRHPRRQPLARLRPASSVGSSHCRMTTRFAINARDRGPSRAVSRQSAARSRSMASAEERRHTVRVSATGAPCFQSGDRLQPVPSHRRHKGQVARRPARPSVPESA